MPIWQNAPYQFDIILPGNHKVGEPGTFYIGGPRLPDEIQTGGLSNFAIVRFPFPEDPLIKYFFYMPGVPTGDGFVNSWQEGYCDQDGVIHIAREVTVNGIGLGDAYMAVVATAPPNDPTPEDRAQIFMDPRASGTVRLLLASYFGGADNAATWFNDGTSSYITDTDPTIDTWIDISANIPVGTAIGGQTVTVSQVTLYCSYDRHITIIGRLTMSGNMVLPINVTIAGFVPAIYRNSDVSAALFKVCEAAVGSGANLGPMSIMLNPNNGQLLVRQSAGTGFPATSANVFFSVSYQGKKP